MKLSKPILLGLALLAGQISASAADLAVLRNGSSIPFLRKEQMGSTTRLYITGGYMDVPTTEISSFDKDDSPPPPAVSAPANPVTSAPAQDITPAKSTPSPAAASTATVSQAEIDEFIREAASRYQLDPEFVRSVVKAESNFHSHAVSPKGAQGLMQLMPQTAASLGVKDAFDPQANVEAGTAHLSALLDQYHDDPIKALAAYNAGAHRVQQYHGVPPYRETRAYVAKIVRDFNAKKRAQMKAAQTANKAAAAKNANKQSKKPNAAPQQASATRHNDPA